MDTIFYLAIGVFIILYIIDKKELVTPIVYDRSEVLPAKSNDIISSDSLDYKTIKRDKVYREIMNTIQEVNPLKTYRVWTYIEIQNNSRNIQNSYERINIPTYLKKCIDKMKENVPELIVLTPLNIKEFLPDFDIDIMNKTSIYPLKFRVDILFASILDKYGGICVSPGTIVYNLSKPLNKLHNFEVVTFGGNPSVINAKNHNLLPNNYVIGSKKNSKAINEYLRNLLMIKENYYKYNYNHLLSQDILSKILNQYQPSQFHYGTDYDGTYNTKTQIISLDEYLGTYQLDFSNKEKLFFISVPYDILFKREEHKWFLYLSEMQFLESNLILKELIYKDI